MNMINTIIGGALADLEVLIGVVIGLAVLVVALVAAIVWLL